VRLGGLEYLLRHQSPVLAHQLWAPAAISAAT